MSGRPYDVFAVIGDSLNGFGWSWMPDGSDSPLYGTNSTDHTPNAHVFSYGNTLGIGVPCIDSSEGWAGWDGHSHYTSWILTFAKTYAATLLAPGRDIMIVAAAAGGTDPQTEIGTGGNPPGVGDWMVGGRWYETFITNTNAAMALNGGTGNKLCFFGGMLGANDANTLTNAATYRGLLTTMIADARSRLTGGTNVPVMMGSYSAQVPLWTFDNIAAPRDAIIALPSYVTNEAYVDTELPYPLTTYTTVDASDVPVPPGSSFDVLHLDALSERELGNRFFAAYGMLAGAGTLGPRYPYQLTF